MKYKVRVFPNAKKNRLVEEEGRLKVFLTAPPVEGKANKALIEYLMEYFGVKRRQITILQGEKSRDKLVEIQTV